MLKKTYENTDGIARDVDVEVRHIRSEDGSQRQAILKR